MERAELETQININLADLDEGFFTIGTSRRGDANRIVKKAKSNVLDCTLSKAQDGSIVWWTFKIHRRALNSTLCIRGSNWAPITDENMVPPMGWVTR